MTTEAGSWTGPVAPRKRWQVREVDETAALGLRDSMGLFATTARVLVARGLSVQSAAEEFLAPGLDALHSPFCFAAMETAVERLLRAVRDQERVAIHGDYDVDGISGSVLLATVLKHLGGDVEVILPHRVLDGYGLEPAGIDRAAELGATVVVAVDCGITAIEACERAAEHGMDVIIADHHLPQDQLPHALAILNPRLEGSGYPEQDLAAVAVAFKLACGVLERSGSTASGLSMLKLVALGTIADLVPLRGENRALAIHGLRALAGAVNPGLQELMKVSKVDPRRVTAGDVGFRLAPRINAAGRVGHPDDAAQMFMTEDRAVARELAGRLERLNTERRELEQATAAAAIEAHADDEGSVIVAAGEGWHRGVIGIVASRLVETTGRPALVVAIEGEDAYGSARSVPAFDVTAALSSASACLEAFGGHKQAAGFRLKASRIDALREAVNEHASQFGSDSLKAVLTCDDVLHPDDATKELALELERLAPFGIGNPRPRFLCEGVRLAGPPQILKDAHLKLQVRSADSTIPALAWRRADLGEALVGHDTVDFVATLRTNRFRGRLEPQFEIDDLRV
ncbi:MAG: single-stranded-DNA-specific exonuclease RecJ [Acidobacteria bacterium]|nr:single-stranded-DNA-specific exonuclease RecJ [Acidobacteriota bacterium]